MSDDSENPGETVTEAGGAPGGGGAASQGEGERQLTPEARRALAEASARRRLTDQNGTTGSRNEIGGRNGPEPTRYGDWEKGGIVSDF